MRECRECVCRGGVPCNLSWGVDLGGFGMIDAQVGWRARVVRLWRSNPWHPERGWVKGGVGCPPSIRRRRTEEGMVRVGRVFRGVGGSGVVVLWAPSVFESKEGTGGSVWPPTKHLRVLLLNRFINIPQRLS